MLSPVKRLVKSTALYPWIFRHRELRDWERQGRPVPPPDLVKQQILRHYARQYRLSVLVETGTYFGDMVEAMRPHFDRIYSIELSRDLHGAAVTRFRNATNVELIQGDSSVELEKLMGRLDRPALFWLDGHYSEGVTARGDNDTPILGELDHVLDAPPLGHVIVIDDARYFGRDPEYPTIEDVTELIRVRRPEYRVTVADDSIRATP